jgi:hypothetical protein
MSHITDLLMPNEEIVVRGKLHLAIILRPAVIGVMGIVLVAAASRSDPCHRKVVLPYRSGENDSSPDG